MDGHDLSVLLDGGEPESRDHFVSGYRNHVCCRDERRVMFGRNDGTKAKLYDAHNDAEQRRDLAEEEPETVEKMFEEYVLKDVGGSAGLTAVYPKPALTHHPASVSRLR